jgi:asparagine synthase (glutamine-hydrolysing)
MLSAWNSIHNGSTIQIGNRKADGRGITATVLLSGDQTDLLHAEAADGSFVGIDGHFVDTGTSLSQVLDDLLLDVPTALRKHEFQGFLVVWNARTQTCVLARDEFGIGVGYLAAVGNGFSFSTDMNTLVHAGIDTSPDETAIDAFLTMGYFPAPMTPLESVSKVPPGRSVSISEAGPQAPHMWMDVVERTRMGEDDAVDAMSSAFRSALDRAWPRDGQAGILLSGGVDSALIAVGASKLLARPVRSFTFRYDQYQGTLNEGARAAAVAQRLGIPHEEIPIGPMEMFDDLDAATLAYGEPFSWGLHSYRLKTVADQGISTIFSGAGADGAGFSRRHRAALQFDNLPSVVRYPVRATVRAGRPLNLPQQDNAEWVTRSVASVGDLYSSDSPARRAQRRRLYRDSDLADRGSERLLGIFHDAASKHHGKGRDRTIQLLGSQFATAEASLTWNRTWAVAHGMTSRLPYFDHEMHDVALHIEGSATGKDVARKLAARYLPNDMAFAPKLPQEMPVDDWLRGPLREPGRERITELPRDMTKIFDPGGVTGLFDEHASGRKNHGWRLISLLTIAAWFDQLPKQR